MTNELRKIVIGTSVIVFIFLAAKVIYAANAVCFTPDDAFYYLQMAKHFAISGQWTFDGAHITNGFHPLWGYILAGMYFVFRFSIDSFPQVAQWLGAGILTGTIIFIAKHEKTETIVWLAFIVTTELVVTQSVSMMEFCLVPICAYGVITNKHRNVFAILGTLSRVEFFILPVIVWIVELVINKKKDYKLFVSTLAGTCIVLANNYLAGGSFIQASVLIKSEWYKFYAPELLHEKAFNLSAVFFYATTFTAKKIVFGLVCLSGIVFGVIKKIESEVVISIVAIIIYTTFQWQNAGVQLWYSSIFVIPVFIIGKYAIQRYKILLIPVLLGLIFNITYQYKELYPQNPMSVRVGKWLGRNNLDGKVGAWSAGILGYYGGGRVVNLDGLVNNSIYQYIEKNQVPEYIAQEKIKYIIDYANMYRPPYLKQGGYDRLEWLVSLNLEVLEEDYRIWWRYLCIARVGK